MLVLTGVFLFLGVAAKVSLLPYLRIPLAVVKGSYVVLQAVPYVPDAAPGTLIESIPPTSNVPPIRIYRLD